MPIWLLAIIAFAEFVGLYLLSQRLTRQVYAVFLYLTNSRTLAITLITLVLFPGTVIHELSHLFAASILGVHTGKLTLVPESISGDTIHAGSVLVAETDPFRRAAIGMAPMVTGLITLMALVWWLWTMTNGIAFGDGALTLPDVSPWLVALALYLIFAVSNTMFSSPEDMKGVPPVIGVLAILGGLAAWFRIFPPLPDAAQTVVASAVTLFIQSIGIVLACTVAGIAVSSAVIRIAERATGKRVVWGS